MSAPIAKTLTERLEEFKKRRSQNTNNLTADVRIFEPKTLPIIIKPAASSWEVLEQKLKQVINFDGVWSTARELYDQGYGAELETIADLVLEVKTNKPPYHLFTKMISKQSGQWQRTLQTAYDTWEVRRNALKVIEDLKLASTSIKAILKLAWRLKTSILRYLGIAMEKGTGIRNPAGVFFALTRKPKPVA